MELLASIPLVLLVLAGLLLLTYIAHQICLYPTIPTVPLSEYLPGALVYKMFANSQMFNICMNELSRKYGDIFQIWMGPMRMVCTCHAEDIVQITTDVATFPRSTGARVAIQQAAAGCIFVLQPRAHRNARQKIRQVFNHTLLPDFHACMQQAAEGTLRELYRITDHGAVDKHGFSKPVEMCEILNAFTSHAVTNAAFHADWDAETRRIVNEKIDEFLIAVAREGIGYPYRMVTHARERRHTFREKSEALRKWYRTLVGQRLEKRARADGDHAADVLDAILDFESDETVASNHMVIFAAAGGHTSAHTMCWALFELSKNEHVMNRIDEELATVVEGMEDADGAFAFEDVGKLELLRKVWKETLRLYPPATVHLREAKEDVVLHGSREKLWKGTMVSALCARAHTHERYWKDSDRFMPDRWGTVDKPATGDRVPAGAYTPFSLGAANCAGKFFADHEGVLMLGEILRRFRVQLACSPSEVVNCNEWVSVGRVARKDDGVLDMGIPFRIKRR